MKSMRYLAAGTVMLVAAFCFLSYAYAMDPTIEVPASTFADRTTGAFTFTVNVINKGTTGSIDGYAKKAQNVLPQPSIIPATRTIGTNQSATFTVTGTLKDPTIAGSVTVKFKYVDDDTSPPPVTVTGDVLITPGPPS